MKSAILLLLPLAASLCAIAPARAEQLRVLADARTPDMPPEQRFFIHHFGHGEMETVAFLGVETEPVPDVLTAQLNLPKDAGLVVRHVVPDSPAASALQVHDVLLKLDDQLLIDPHQFAVLVRNHKEGDEVTLTYLRGGKEATVKVKLVKHDVPKMALLDSPAMDGRNFMFRALGPDEAPPGGPEAMDRELALLDQHAGPPGPAVHRIEIERRQEPGLQALSVNPGNSNIVYRDEKGTLELTVKDGRKTLVAKDAKGAQLFSGAIDTPEQRKAMPAEVRQRLEQLEGMQDFSFKTDGNFHEDVKVLRRAQDISLPLPPPPAQPPEPRPEAF